MATQEWKKLTKYCNKEETIWNKGDIDVVVSDRRNNAVENKKYPYSFLVARVDNSNDGNYEHIISKWVGTKQEALNSANKYMRDN